MESFTTVISRNIADAVTLLKQGECVAIPTETVYGLAANALDTKAVAKIFEAKQRPTFDPLIIHTDTVAKVQQYVTQWPAMAAQLSKHFWPGPLTMLLPKQNVIPDLVTSGLSRVAVRIPNHPITLALLAQLDFPLAAPSANPFGYISPTKASHVYDQLNGRIPMILDGDNSEIGLESTIVGFEGGLPVVYRLGGLAVEAIEQVIGKVKVLPHSSSSPQSPGMLLSHYAPHKPLIFDNLKYCLDNYATTEIGVICFDAPILEIPLANQIVLSPTGSLPEAAMGLFAAMRMQDTAKVQVIYAPAFTSHGLGLAINDRLRRASVR